MRYDYTRKAGGRMDQLKNFYDEVAKVAYELYEKRGRVHGQDREDWFKAEMIVKKRYEKGMGQAAGVVKQADRNKSATKAR
jgi:hypothetical protein